MTTATIDPVTFEVIRHRLWAINDDQARMAARLSGSATIYEHYDFNATLTTGDGRGLYCGVYIMHHGATIDGFVREVLRLWPAEEIRVGDMFFTNDPWAGALHANDGILAMPIHSEGELVAWSAIVMHDSDVGGPTPGSAGVRADDRFGEAPLLPPIKIVENFEPRQDVERAYLRNSRSPELNALNMRARIAALKSTHERIGQLIETYGNEAFLVAQDGILDYVERVVSSRLAEIPDGEWFSQVYHDHDGHSDRIYPIRCRVTKRGSRLIVDFAGTAEQAPGGINCARPAMEGAVMGVILTYLCYDLPWSVGALRDLVEIRSEPGTINNAVSPAPVGAASVMGTLSTQDVVANAFAKMLLSSERYRGEAQATWNPGISGGFLLNLHRDGSLAFVGLVSDPFAGGGGARTDSDGIDTGGIFHSMASRSSNVETLEAKGALLQIYRRQLRDGGGVGRFRGGVGLESATIQHKIEAPGIANMMASGVAVPGGRGLSGGLPGGAASVLFLRDTDVRQQFSDGHVPHDAEAIHATARDVSAAKAFTPELAADDVIVGRVANGSGYGDPLLRVPLAVADDVRRGLVSELSARADHGVVLAADGTVDVALTDQARADLRAARLAEATVGEDASPAAVLDDGEILHPVSDTVEAVAHGDQRSLRCTVCHHRFGDYEHDHKRSAAMRERPVNAVSVINAHCREDYVLREFFCPGCGTSVAADVQHRDEPILDESRFFLPQSE